MRASGLRARGLGVEVWGFGGCEFRVKRLKDSGLQVYNLRASHNAGCLRDPGAIGMQIHIHVHLVYVHVYVYAYMYMHINMCTCLYICVYVIPKKIT